MSWYRLGRIVRGLTLISYNGHKVIMSCSLMAHKRIFFKRRKSTVTRKLHKGDVN